MINKSSLHRLCFQQEKLNLKSASKCWLHIANDRNHHISALAVMWWATAALETSSSEAMKITSSHGWKRNAYLSNQMVWAQIDQLQLATSLKLLPILLTLQIFEIILLTNLCWLILMQIQPLNLYCTLKQHSLKRCQTVMSSSQFFGVWDLLNAPQPQLWTSASQYRCPWS